MSKKSRGIAAERELIKKFWEKGWAAIRVAGSGSSQFPSPDLMVGNKIRVFAIEVKITKDHKKYFPSDEIKQLLNFAEYFGCEPWIAIKFLRYGWFFINPEDLDKTPENFCISLEKANFKGLKMDEITQTL